MSFTDTIANGFQNLLIKNFAKKKIKDYELKNLLEDLKKILLDADVNYKVTSFLLENIKIKMEKVFIDSKTNVEKKFVEIVYEEFLAILNFHSEPLKFDLNLNTIMMVGLQGSGKTTTSAKIANIASEKKQKTLLVACDLARPGAVEQLKELGAKHKIPVFYNQKADTPQDVTKEAIAYAKLNNFQTIIFDTAGRLHLDDNLMEELLQLKKMINPTEILFVCDGASGQNITEVVTNFNQKLKINGLIMTKLDGTSKGGSVLSLSHLTQIPIKFIGTGEKIHDLETFYPDRIASRILGMGDIATLLEKSEEKIDKNKAEHTMQRMMSGQFDLNDFLIQMQQMKKIGKLSGIMNFIPGLSNKISKEKIHETEKELYLAEIILNSTTEKERQKPQLLRHPNRQKRVLKGSGRTIPELNRLLSNYERIKKNIDMISKNLNKGTMPNLPNMPDLSSLFANSSKK